MGAGSSSSAKIENEVKNNIINKSTLNQLSQMTLKAMVDVTVKNVQECGFVVMTGQQLGIGNIINVGQNQQVDISQKNFQMLNFDCLNKTETQSKIINDIIAQVAVDIGKKLTTQTQNNLTSKANARATNDFLGLGPSNADADTKNKIKNKVENIDSKTIKNIVDIAISTNFTSENMAKCTSFVKSNQQIIVKNIINAGASQLITIAQDTQVQLFQKCVQESGVTTNISNKMANFYGLKVRDDTSTSVENTVTAAADAVAENLGPIGSIGSAIGNALSPITDLLNSLLGWSLDPSVFGSLCTLSCSISICLIVLCVISSLVGVGIKMALPKKLKK